MRLLLAHTKAASLELFRYPAFSVPTLLFPALFFLFFVTTRPDLSGRRADLFLAAFIGFAVLGVAFFQFGVGIAIERVSPWEAYMRTLPLKLRIRFAARLLSALQFGLGAVLCLAVVAVLTTPAGLPPGRWLLLGLTALLGSVPFALLGIALGYWARPRGALPLANILYLGLSFAGGLWTSGQDIPSDFDDFSKVFPSRHFAEVLWGAALGDAWRPWSWLALTGYAVVFGSIARWGYLRDEGERYH